MVLGKKLTTHFLQTSTIICKKNHRRLRGYEEVRLGLIGGTEREKHFDVYLY